MNKQELIKAVTELPVDASGPRPKIDHLTTLELIKLLDGPEKPVVPQFVADFYEEHKDDFDYSLWEYLVYWDSQEPSDFKTWIADGDKYEPLIILVNMHQFGYEVEKEKRYLVKFKKVEKGFNFLNFDTVGKEWKIFDCNNTLAYRTHHTRKELEEAGFGWVFDCEGVEVEEVE